MYHARYWTIPSMGAVRQTGIIVKKKQKTVVYCTIQISVRMTVPVTPM